MTGLTAAGDHVAEFTRGAIHRLLLDCPGEARWNRIEPLSRVALATGDGTESAGQTGSGRRSKSTSTRRTALPRRQPVQSPVGSGGALGIRD